VRYLILSDIHGNLPAFEAVLADAGQFDQIWCLGDIIGYGPQPNECIARLRQFAHSCVAGNHDWAAINKLDISAFNPEARKACLWTREQLTPALGVYRTSSRKAGRGQLYAGSRQPTLSHLGVHDSPLCCSRQPGLLRHGLLLVWPYSHSGRLCRQRVTARDRNADYADRTSGFVA